MEPFGGVKPMNGGAGGMVRCTTTSRHCNIASWARSRTCTRRHTQWCYSTWHRRRKIPGGRSRCIVYGCGCGQMELRIWLWFNIRGPDQQIHVYIYVYLYVESHGVKIPGQQLPKSNTQKIWQIGGLGFESGTPK